MEQRFVTLTLIAAGVAGATAAPRQTQGTYRAETAVVTVDVSVTRNDRPVAGLTAADFVVTDNRVRQSAEVVSTEGIPANVTLLVETSGSLGASTASLQRDLTDAAALLRDEDRLRVLGYAADTTQLSPMRPARDPLPLDRLETGGQPSLFNALALTLFRKRPPDRAELVVALTTGIDRGSTLGAPRLREIVRRSDAMLYVVLIDTAWRTSFCYGSPDLCKEKDLRQLAEATGGRLIRQGAGRRLPQALEDALAAFYSSYTLRYVRRGVPDAGWHDIGVSLVRGGRLTIRARRGYMVS
jgi:VWFA-related protein